MKKNTYHDSYNRTFSEIEQNNKLEIHHIKRGETLPIDAVGDILLRGLKDKNEFDIPSHYSEPLLNLGYFEIYWTYIGNSIDYKAYGEIGIYPLINSLMEPTLGFEKDDLNLSECSNIHEYLSIFDDHAQSGDSQFSAFEIRKRVFPPSIWFHDRGELVKLDLNILEYLEALFITKGISGWHYFFCDLNKYGSEQLIKKLEQNIRILQEVFPEGNIDVLKNKLNGFSHI